MEKKTIPPAADPLPRPPATTDSGVEPNDRDRSLVDDVSLPVLGSPPRLQNDHEIRGRRYRMSLGDGYIGIWSLRTGERVATFMEDASDSASQRFTELEQARSVAGAASSIWALALERWYLVAVLILGGLTVAYLKSEDPALSRTSSSSNPLAVRPTIPAATGELGFAVAKRLSPGRLLTPATPSPPRPEPTKRPPAGVGAQGAGGGQGVSTAPSTAPSPAGGGGSSGQAGTSGGGTGTSGDGGSSDPSGGGGGGPPAGATGPHDAPSE
jgi:hypothetical protein